METYRTFDTNMKEGKTTKTHKIRIEFESHFDINIDESYELNIALVILSCESDDPFDTRLLLIAFNYCIYSLINSPVTTLIIAAKTQ